MVFFNKIPVLTLMCCFFALNTKGADEFSRKKSTSRARSYLDFLNDVSSIGQHSNAVVSQEIKGLAENFTKALFDVFQYFHRRRGNEEQRKCSSQDAAGENGGICDISNSNMNDKYRSNAVITFENMMEKLQDMKIDENNQNVSLKCMNDTMRLINGLLKDEHWTYPFLDSTGKPGPGLAKKHFNFVGDYDECRAAIAPDIKQNGTYQEGFEGNYCVVELYSGNPFYVPQIGACLPRTCSSKQIGDFVEELIKNVTNLPVTVECRSAPTDVSTATIAAFTIIAIIGVMMVLGTSYDLVVVSKEVTHPEFQRPNTKAQRTPLFHNAAIEESMSSDNIVSLADYETSPLLVNSEARKMSLYSPDSLSTCAKVLLAFSVYSNGKKLLNTSQAPGNLGAVHGIRFLSMTWVVLCHTCLNILPLSVNFADFAPQLIQKWTYLPILNGFLSADTFFTLSGLLTSYLTIKEMARRKSWNINWPIFYFHRFWRLTPPYMLSIVTVLGLMQYLGEGPLWGNLQLQDKLFCEKNWWTNLLYINNLVKSREMCFGHSWYLANDVQFFILSPFILLPFYLNRFAGFMSCVVFLTASTVTTGVLSSEHNWPTTIVPQALFSNSFSSSWYNDYYIKPWCRIGPFIVGMFAGYILAQTKGKPFKMPRLVVITGWVFSLAVGLACVYGLHGDISGKNVSSTGVAAFYNAVSRPAWGACISWVIIACSAGYGGPIQTLLSWAPFVFLGRLTYMSYLIHLCILGVVFGNLGWLIYMNELTFALIFLGVLVLVNMAAFVFVLAFESPMLALEKFIFKRVKTNES